MNKEPANLMTMAMKPPPTEDMIVATADLKEWDPDEQGQT